MAYEFSASGLDAIAFAYQEATNSATCGAERDPLDIILELEQLAYEEGYPNVHTYIQHYLGE